MNGRKREMVLYAAKFKRSKVDLLTFPFPEELEQPWRMTLRTHNGKRKLTAPSTSSPNKKILCQALTQPLFPLIRPLIPLIRPLIPIQEPLPAVPLEMMLQAARERIDQLFSHPSIAKEVRNRRIRSLLTARHDAKYQSDYSNSIVKRIFADHSNNEITPYILGVEEGVELTANQLTLTREKMSIVMDMETLIGQKYEEKYDYISSILLRISDPNIFSEYLDWKSTWKQKYSMPVLIKRIHSNKCVEIKSDNTLLRWYNDFKRSSNHGWAMDMRGSYDRGEFFLLAHSLDEISLQERVIHYVKHEPEFTVAKCATWLRNLISTRFPLDHAARKITICTTTMYHWLDIIGAKFETQTKSYYTDNHESEYNVKYRSIYIKRHAYLSMRQPVWISVPLNEVSSHAYEDAQFRSKFQILQK
jgi:hypothetical protein